MWFVARCTSSAPMCKARSGASDTPTSASWGARDPASLLGRTSPPLPLSRVRELAYGFHHQRGRLLGGCLYRRPLTAAVPCCWQLAQTTLWFVFRDVALSNFNNPKGGSNWRLVSTFMSTPSSTLVQELLARPWNRLRLDLNVNSTPAGQRGKASQSARPSLGARPRGEQPADADLRPAYDSDGHARDVVVTEDGPSRRRGGLVVVGAGTAVNR
mmetsp:Transcript_23015/g.41133  ORF Transcript_23015/g.41133 Transcript_23015/m.41133 type:complete len:214 (+) Transcript_23015:471-1112(+)